MLIIAPSSAGKSHFVKKHPTFEGHTLIDGDKVISDTIGWPDDPHWWKQPSDVRRKYHVQHTRAMADYLEENPSHVVLWNTNLDVLAAEAIAPIRIVVPPDEVLTRNVESKRQEQAKGKKRGQPSRDAEVLGDAKKKRAAAKRYGWPVLIDFETAIRSIVND